VRSAGWSFWGSLSARRIWSGPGRACGPCDHSVEEEGSLSDRGILTGEALRGSRPGGTHRAGGGQRGSEAARSSTATATATHFVGQTSMWMAFLARGAARSRRKDCAPPG